MAKILEYFIFREEFFIIFEVFEHLIKIASFCVLHDDAKFVFGGVIDFFESDDILMDDHVVELSLLEGLLFLFGLKMSDVDSFHDVEFVVLGLALDEVDFAHGALAEDFDFFIFFLFITSGVMGE